MKEEEVRIDQPWKATVRKTREGYIVSWLFELAGNRNDRPIYRREEEHCATMRDVFWCIADYFAVNDPPIEEEEETKE